MARKRAACINAQFNNPKRVQPRGVYCAMHQKRLTMCCCFTQSTTNHLDSLLLRGPTHHLNSLHGMFATLRNQTTHLHSLLMNCAK
eukprot:10363976-Lingulodinium_polyedra.AAC.1